MDGKAGAAMSETFTVTKDHLRLLRHMRVDWNGDESGAPTIDPKRPYGNSDVAVSVMDVLGWTVQMDPDDWDVRPEQRAMAVALHGETQRALQIVLCTGQFRAGTYIKTDPYNNLSWRLEES